MTDVGLDVVRFVYQMMQIEAEWAVWSDRGFTWWASSLAQHVWAEPCFEEEGFTVARVHVRTDLLNNFADTDARLLQLMELSYFATLGGLVRHPEEPSSIQLASSIYAHSDTADWLQQVLGWVAAIQNAEAHAVAVDLAKSTGARLAVSKHPSSGARLVPDDLLNLIRARVVPDGQHPSLYAGEDLLDTLAFFQNPPCVLATGSDNALRAEFPFGDFTSLLQMETRAENPWLGNGLLALLSVPGTECGKENVEAARLALELNEEEVSSLTRAHFLGSWCPGNQALTFASFLPNAMRLAGGLPKVLVGTAMTSRAAWVATEVFRVGFDYHQATSSMSARVESLARRAEEQAGKGKAERAGHKSAPSGPPPATALLEQARAETQGDCRRPCTPFPAAPFLDAAKEIVPLLSCGIFNPFGPTLETILLARPTAEADWLVVDVQSNPFAPTEMTGRGWQPAAVDPAQLGALLAAVEAAHTGESGFLLTQSTYVVVPPGAQVGAAAWKEVFRRALIREGVTWPRAVCRSIRANWCKPWDRAQAELTAALDAKAKGRRPIPKSRESDAPMTAAEFEDWWQLIAHPDHVAHEVKELPAAWQRALEQAPGVAAAMGGNPDALRFHWAFLQPVLSAAGGPATGGT
jgi:hypothetical protein